MQKDLSQKRLKEQRVVEEMIRLYCHKTHHSAKGQLCPECKALLEYAQKKSEKCPFMKNKSFCSACAVHCYSAEMREKIRTVMRFSGPRMLLYHPFLALWHLKVTIEQKNQKNRQKGNKKA